MLYFTDKEKKEPLLNLMFKLPWIDKMKFTGLEIESGFIKLALAQEYTRGRKKIIKLIIKDLSLNSEKDVITSLRNTISEVKIPIEHLVVSIPRHKVTVRFLRFPTLNEKEIAGMVSLQSAKELPYSKEELISDYLITERSEDGYAKVALVIVHQDVINGYLNILKKAGLQAERISFSTEAIVDWYIACCGQEKTKDCSILIDLDSDNVDIVILRGLSLDFTRGLTWGLRQLQENPDLKYKLVEELKRTISGYSRQDKAKRVERILLESRGDLTEPLNNFLEAELHLPCRVFTPLKNLACPRKICAVRYNPALSLLRVLGAVLAGKGKKLNLLPPSVRQKQQFDFRRKRFWGNCVLISGVFWLSLLIFGKKIQDKQLYLSYLCREIEQTAPFAQDAENMLKRINLIEARRRIKGSSVDILRQLHILVPDNISLSSFNFAEYDEENKFVSLQGICTSMSDIFRFINILEKSAYFKNVQLKYVSEEKVKASGFTDFKIECILE